jgi:hypothetical protein
MNLREIFARDGDLACVLLGHPDAIKPFLQKDMLDPAVQNATPATRLRRGRILSTLLGHPDALTAYWEACGALDENYEKEVAAHNAAGTDDPMPESETYLKLNDAVLDAEAAIPLWRR